MAKFFARRISYDITRIEEVPDQFGWRDAVRALIEETEEA